MGRFVLLGLCCLLLSLAGCNEHGSGRQLGGDRGTAPVQQEKEDGERAKPEGNEPEKNSVPKRKGAFDPSQDDDQNLGLGSPGEITTAYFTGETPFELIVYFASVRVKFTTDSAESGRFDEFLGRRFSLVSDADGPYLPPIRATLECLSERCRESEVVFSSGREEAIIRSVTSPLLTHVVEIQDECEIPLFFDVDLERIFSRYENLEEPVAMLRSAKSAYASDMEITNWSGEFRRQISILLNSSRGAVVFSDRNASSEHRLDPEAGERFPVTSEITYKMVPTSDSEMLDSILFKLLGSSADRSSKWLCVQLLALPDFDRW